jgi:hypothetical protein
MSLTKLIGVVGALLLAMILSDICTGLGAGETGCSL